MDTQKEKKNDFFCLLASTEKEKKICHCSFAVFFDREEYSGPKFRFPGHKVDGEFESGFGLVGSR